MPYKSEKIKLQGLQDRRRKLEDYQYDEIKHKYETGLYSQNRLAKEYNVSRSLIAIIVNPKRAEAVRQRNKEHWRDYQTFGKKHNETIQKTRAYKHELYVNGKLKGE